jgi:hypothetical protein
MAHQTGHILYTEQELHCPKKVSGRIMASPNPPLPLRRRYRPAFYFSPKVQQQGLT